ncbi:MAG: GNAT family N-acetyltransferase [Clostridia bacterium]|nr:GNAT family N-acetyltransferase [Clostridia bacterium]MBQ4272181.1 GNAT family N-acetyltransferase [Clostridia bacterium]
MSVTYKIMQKEDIDSVIPLFIEYWNGTGDQWTYDLVYKRIWQVLGSPDSYCLMAFEGENVVAFAMGRMETFFDLTAYNLVEIVVTKNYQNKGIGTQMMLELEKRVKQLGVSLIQLSAVNDDMHEHFYGKLGYKNTTSMNSKGKFL